MQWKRTEVRQNTEYVELKRHAMKKLKKKEKWKNLMVDTGVLFLGHLNSLYFLDHYMS